MTVDAQTAKFSQRQRRTNSGPQTVLQCGSGDESDAAGAEGDGIAQDRIVRAARCICFIARRGGVDAGGSGLPE